MNLFEFENQQFNDLWNEENIKEVRQEKPKLTVKESFTVDIDNDYQEEKYREFQEQNFNEYFTGSYKYRLWK